MLLLRIKESQHTNASDKDIVEALERLFILDPPKTDDPEDEYDYVMLRDWFSLFFFITVTRIIFLLMGVKSFSPESYNMFSGIYSTVATIFFTWFFVMLHFETKQTSNIMLLFIWIACLFSLW